MTLIHDEAYWNERWNTNQTGWDIGYTSTPLQAYFEQLVDKNLKIIIPGAGNAYEAESLHKLGFTNVWVIDIAPEAIDLFKKRVPDFPEEHLICGNFFDLNDQFDLMIEQTFFCALHPSERERYCQQTQRLLKSKGKLVGLLFSVPLFSDHPPYGGNEEEYRPLFSRYFSINVMEPSTNSIKPRMGNELFIKLVKE
ncbi:MAG: SAM-dependent methyltransferase [Crocinitomicaceae bacterium]|nr:SAM-dependent methyltransferase [Crocinitomicaceae bacterium]|tara:strand:- start:1395 stop:1982 length:588 start_codon:yes stop_codon:yes gene_type:complete